MSPRWVVERRTDQFEDVGAHDVHVDHGGTLVFTTASQVVVMYAPGTWLTVCPEEG